MSAEPSQTTSSEDWTTWQNQVVQGRFALRRCLGWTDHSAVFLTEHKAKNLAEAAIKLVRADAPQAQSLLLRWQAALNLSHAHLVQLFEVGRHEFEGHDYQFVVMEYGDQTLAEILRRRPLGAEELQELLPPVLEALTFLHRRQLVHGRLKPSNFLAVGDLLKLASDTIRPAGQDHGTSTAGDVWSLGATLVEAIMARGRIASDQRFDVTSLPAGLPASLVDMVQRCLSPSPADRPSIIELRAENKPGASPAAPVTKPEPPKQKVSQEVATPPRAVPTTPREVVPPQPAQATSRVAASTPPLSNATREASLIEPTQAASRVAVTFHPVPNASEEAYRPVQTASQVTVSFHPVSSTPDELASPHGERTDLRVAAPSRPVSNTPREAAPLQAANTGPRAVAPVQAVPSTPRDAASPQAANTAPRVVAPSEPVPSASRDATSPQAANTAPRVAVPAQPVPATPRDAASPQVANTPPRVIAPSQPAPSASRETASPQAANIGQRVVAPAQPVPSAPREAASPQVANTGPRVVAPSQPAPSAPRETTSPQASNTASRVAAPAQPVSSTPRDAVPPRAASSTAHVTASSQTASSTLREVARPQPAPTTTREIASPPPAPSASREAFRPASSSAARESAQAQQVPNIARVAVPPQTPATHSREAGPSESTSKRLISLLGIAAGALLLVIAVWIGMRSTSNSPAPLQTATVPTPIAPSVSEQVATSEPTVATQVDSPQAQLASESTSSILNEVLPIVPDKIQNKIQGRVYVTVRVLVEPAGNVMGVLMENAGPSKYFARLSDKAAREWQFVPADTDAARVWLLRFEYTRNGASVRTFEQ